MSTMNITMDTTMDTTNAIIESWEDFDYNFEVDNEESDCTEENITLLSNNTTKYAEPEILGEIPRTTLTSILREKKRQDISSLNKEKQRQLQAEEEEKLRLNKLLKEKKEFAEKMKPHLKWLKEPKKVEYISAYDSDDSDNNNNTSSVLDPEFPDLSISSTVSTKKQKVKFSKISKKNSSPIIRNSRHIGTTTKVDIISTLSEVKHKIVKEVASIIHRDTLVESMEELNKTVVTIEFVKKVNKNKEEDLKEWKEVKKSTRQKSMKKPEEESGSSGVSKKFLKTQFCRSYLTNGSCPHGKNCRYAHNRDEMIIRTCAYAHNCRLVKEVENGIYKNLDTNKKCNFLHLNEEREDYFRRMY